MLYVSRTVRDGGIGVVDTDDGVETIVTVEELERIVNLDVLIVGVDTMRTSSGKLIVVSVNVNKGPSKNLIRQSSMSLQQVKGNVLQGIDVEVIDDRIMSIQWGTVLPSGEHVVLSNYGVSFDDHARFWPQPDKIDGRCSSVEFILDDKIRMTEVAILSAFSCNHAVLNITRVTSSDTISMVYKMLYKYFYVDCYNKKVHKFQKWLKYAMTPAAKANADERIKRAKVTREQDFLTGFNTAGKLIDLPERKAQWRAEFLRKL